MKPKKQAAGRGGGEKERSARKGRLETTSARLNQNRIDLGQAKRLAAP